MRTIADLIAGSLGTILRRHQRTADADALPEPYAFADDSVVISLSPVQDHAALPAALDARDDGAPGVHSGLDTRYLMSRLFHSRRARRGRRRTTIGAPTRLFAELGVRDADVRDCRGTPGLSELELRHGDLVAIRWLRRLRAAGADMLIVDGAEGVPVGVIFVTALRRSVPILAEELMVSTQEGLWTRRDPGRRADGWSLARARLRARTAVTVIVTSLGLSIAADLVEPPVADLADALLTVPGWAACALIAAATASLVACAGRSHRRRREPTAVGDLDCSAELVEPLAIGQTSPSTARSAATALAPSVASSAR
ncbi:hypothetical protein VSS74_25905 [Conexibacter stalactiti]|uniref:Uncharacterized protein n=1 Tax=Conexibacter stalactiti TaxID=1940611 RepID=A0ABU4I0F8_9ACTN|nr:hypothetical protein [Conexibacter stalactiti]MDW5597814.1 hypothetical protein [Conexibacter stalactiti]MEC5038456.1 hypothetical protein [Conexibacter stalactiti]